MRDSASERDTFLFIVHKWSNHFSRPLQPGFQIGLEAIVSAPAVVADPRHIICTYTIFAQWNLTGPDRTGRACLSLHQKPSNFNQCRLCTVQVAAAPSNLRTATHILNIWVPNLYWMAAMHIDLCFVWFPHHRPRIRCDCIFANAVCSAYSKCGCEQAACECAVRASILPIWFNCLKFIGAQHMGKYEQSCVRVCVCKHYIHPASRHCIVLLRKSLKLHHFASAEIPAIIEMPI